MSNVVESVEHQENRIDDEPGQTSALDEVSSVKETGEESKDVTDGSTDEEPSIDLPEAVLPSEFEQEEQGCDICGSEIREGAEFCYNCGSEIRKRVDVQSHGESADAVEIDTAMAMPKREKRRTRPPKKRIVRETTVRWEEPEGVRLSYIFFAVAMIVVTVIVLLLAFYIR